MDNDDFNSRIENKLDQINNNVGEINITLAKQHISLEEHMRRTRILEEKIMPLERNNNEFRGIMKLGGVILTLITAAALLADLIGRIK